MTSKNIVITIDGPAGAGKSSVARGVAKRLGLSYLDTGALYRAIAYTLDKAAIPPVEGESLSATLRDLSVALASGRVFVDGKDVTDLIRNPLVDSLASKYSALPSVRARLLDIQREQVLGGGLVADGRDMGTVVFPLAPLKIFLTASEEVRARRRFDELVSRGQVDVDFDSVLEDIKTRDRSDRERACSPLVEAPDSVVLDSSSLSVDQVVDRIVSLAEGARSDD
ncbi:(d)CMP kinase [Dethiosulfovibrio salsuginis]|uniref:Cytidylate kinase n=1 Tax=Dethiosulfovibrio salsuginis TaxID=561720 RepID=A0A1X7IBL3_9BACT|nr:(d)CMP kinase [Dethiosulfovibrio salsuginis]SMG11464.1 cytidylate kinase [Dethiosulfovibrio salsuginis]